MKILAKTASTLEEELQAMNKAVRKLREARLFTEANILFDISRQWIHVHSTNDIKDQELVAFNVTDENNTIEIDATSEMPWIDYFVVTSCVNDNGFRKKLPFSIKFEDLQNFAFKTGNNLYFNTKSISEILQKFHGFKNSNKLQKSKTS